MKSRPYRFSGNRFSNSTIAIPAILRADVRALLGQARETQVIEGDVLGFIDADYGGQPRLADDPGGFSDLDCILVSGSTFRHRIT